MAPAAVKRSLGKRAMKLCGLIAFLAPVMMVGAACSRTSSTPRPCLQFSSDLMPDLAGGLVRKDFRIANAWAVKSDQMIDSSGVKFPAYFLSADIIAPSGEAVPATWITTQIAKPGLIWSISPQAKKYSSWVNERRGYGSMPSSALNPIGRRCKRIGRLRAKRTRSFTPVWCHSWCHSQGNNALSLDEISARSSRSLLQGRRSSARCGRSRRRRGGR